MRRPAWVPWTALDRLFLELADNLHIPAIAKAHQRNEALINTYFQVKPKDEKLKKCVWGGRGH
jgi:hypothetical protein